MDERLDTFLELCQQLSAALPQPLVLATVIAGGSSAAGGRAWIDTQGQIYGAVTLGGCIDHLLKQEAALVQATGLSRVLEAELGSGAAYEFGMTCEAHVTIHLQVAAPTDPLWQQVAARRSKGQAVTLRTELAGHTHLYEGAAKQGLCGGAFVEQVAAPLSLIIVGSGPIVRPLASMARTVGMQVSVRASLEHGGPDERSLVIICSHQYDQEVDALRAALASPARYIGLVASRRRGAAVLDFLQSTGTPTKQLKRVRTPAGLHLGQESPAGIALSILTQMVQETHQGSATPLSGPSLYSTSKDTL